MRITLLGGNHVNGTQKFNSWRSVCFVIMDLISVAEGTVLPIPEGYCLHPENFVDEFP